MKLSWTEAKRAKTLQERGLDFARAAEVFAGLHVTPPSLPSPASGERGGGGRSCETRLVTAGFLDSRLVVMVWTPRRDARHIISMRYAHAKEQKLWKEEMDGFR